MKKFSKVILTLSLLFLGFNLVSAQQNNVVVSEIQVYDEGDGTATVEVRLSGNATSSVRQGTISVSGDAVQGGSMATAIYNPTRPCVECGGNQSTVLIGTFPIDPGARDKFVDVDVSAGAAIVIGNRNRLKQRPRPYIR